MAMSRDLKNYQQEYAASPFEEIMVKVRRRLILDFIGKHGFQDIMEVGCGGWPLFADLADFRSFNLVEPGAVFFEKARAAAEIHKHRNRIQTHQLRFEEMDSHKPVDCIIISSLLHELSDPAAILHHAFRLGPKGCWLHVNVPNAKSFHRLLAVESGLIKTEYEPSATQIRLQQNHTFDLQSLQKFVSASGFSVVESASYFIKPFTHAQMQQLVDLGILTEALISGLLKLERHAPGLGAEIFVNARK
jgi:SAM-dependent methyltransferase